MAPESLTDRLYTTASDVWAFGVVLWEIMSLGGSPYPTVGNQEIPQYLENGKRLRQPKNCPDAIYEIMSCCWQQHAVNRPVSDVCICMYVCVCVFCFLFFVCVCVCVF